MTVARATATDVDRIARVALAMGAARDTRSVFRSLHEFVAQLTPMNGMFVSLYDPVTRLRTCVYAASDGAEVDVSQLPPLPVTDSPNSRAVVTGEVIITDDFRPVLANNPHVDVHMDKDPRPPASAIVVPMRMEGRVVGAFELQSGTRGAFRPEHVAPLQLVANLAAISLENVALKERLERKVEERTRELKVASEALQRQHVARDTVRAMLRDLSRATAVPPMALREMGRRLAGDVKSGAIAGFVDAFATMGLGTLRHESSSNGRHRFGGQALLENDLGSWLPTCHLTLGFLEGVISAVEGGRGLGTELRCQSQGHEECVFVVASRPVSEN